MDKQSVEPMNESTTETPPNEESGRAAPDKAPVRPEDIQKDIEEFIGQKYGGKVQFFAKEMPAFAAPPQMMRPEKNIEKRKKVFSFEFKPKEIKSHLDRFVIKQDEAKKALSIAVCDHYNRVKACLENPEKIRDNYAKQNILMLGPSGVGKTYLVKRIAKLIGVPFVKADATRFSETGYVGANVDDIVRDLVTQADGDIGLAQYGIVYLDEADKIASSPKGSGRDVSGRGVQFGLLKLMEESDVDLRQSHDMVSQIQAMMEFQQKGKLEKKMVNTRHILFILTGAFTGLDDIVRKRVSKRRIGLDSNVAGDKQKEIDELLCQVSTQDLMEFGFEPELVGRLPVRVSCEHLNTEDLFHILTESEESLTGQYKEAFASYGISLSFDKAALKKVAALASLEKTGARALMTVCERLLRNYKFELPSSSVQELNVTSALVDEPVLHLARILKSAGKSSTQKAKN